MLNSAANFLLFNPQNAAVTNSNSIAYDRKASSRQQPTVPAVAAASAMNHKPSAVNDVQQAPASASIASDFLNQINQQQQQVNSLMYSFVTFEGKWSRLFFYSTINWFHKSRRGWSSSPLG